ncbi:hypothetical protein DVH05_023459 [Phytophthora capsici]|nr:hypothetical protein DVH05_023459 [Phytophthora capsici]
MPVVILRNVGASPMATASPAMVVVVSEKDGDEWSWSLNQVNVEPENDHAGILARPIFTLPQAVAAV